MKKSKKQQQGTTANTVVTTTTTTTTTTSSMQAALQERIAELEAQQALTKHIDDLHDKKLNEADNLLHAGADNSYKVLHSKYRAQILETKRAEKDLFVTQKALDVVKQEHEKMKKQYDIMAQIKIKMEEYARDVQKKNQQIVEENHRIIKDQEEKRAKLQQEFKATIDQVSEKLKMQSEDKLESLKQTQALQQELFLSQQRTDIMGKQFEAELKKASLERALLEAQLMQQLEVHKAESTKTNMVHDQMKDLIKTNEILQNKLSEYAHKFDSIQDGLKRSTETVQYAKSEAKQRSDENVILLKYKIALEQQVADTQKLLITSQKELLEEKKKNQENEKKIQALEKMSRAFQEQLKTALQNSSTTVTSENTSNTEQK